MANDIMVHHRVMRDEISKCYGYEVATEGDSFIVAFRTPEDAILWSIRVQVDFSAHGPSLSQRLVQSP